MWFIAVNLLRLVGEFAAAEAADRAWGEKAFRATAVDEREGRCRGSLDLLGKPVNRRFRSDEFGVPSSDLRVEKVPVALATRLSLAECIGQPLARRLVGLWWHGSGI